MGVGEASSLGVPEVGHRPVLIPAQLESRWPLPWVLALFSGSSLYSCLPQAGFSRASSALVHVRALVVLTWASGGSWCGQLRASPALGQDFLGPRPGTH